MYMLLDETCLDGNTHKIKQSVREREREIQKRANNSCNIIYNMAQNLPFPPLPQNLKV